MSTLYLTQIVYVRRGHEETFAEFEEGVLPLLSKYRGELLLRLRPTSESLIGGTFRLPFEIQVLRFDAEEDFIRYLNDKTRRRYLPQKEKAVRAAVLIKGTTCDT